MHVGRQKVSPSALVAPAVEWMYSEYCKSVADNIGRDTTHLPTFCVQVEPKIAANC